MRRGLPSALQTDLDPAIGQLPASLMHPVARWSAAA